MQQFHSHIVTLVFPLTSSNQERQLKRLLLIQSRVAESLVPLSEILILQTHTTTSALRDRITSKLQVHTAQNRATLLVNLKRRAQFRQDRSERAGLNTRRRRARVAVHRVALPDDDVAGLAHGFDVDGEQLFDFAVAVAGDQGNFADFLAGVDDVEELCQVGGGG